MSLVLLVSLFGTLKAGDKALPSKYVNPFPSDKFYSSELKELADNNFKFDEIGRKFSKRVENNVGIGPVSHSVFKRFVLQARKKQGLFGKELRESH